MAGNGIAPNNDSLGHASPTLRRLAEVCVDAARKSLRVLQALQSTELIGQ